MWFPCWHKVVTILTPHGFQVYTTWFACGQHVVSMWTPCGFQEDTTVFQMWTSYDFHVKITLFLYGQNMVSIWTPCSFHVDTMWVPHGHHVVFMWTPHGLHVTDFHHFHITSVANRSWKIANLWKPVTSLIMVRFSIRKKFWKALGVLYQLVLFFMLFFP